MYTSITRADVAGDVVETKKHVVTWRRIDTPRGVTCVYMRVCACVRTCVCTLVTREISFPIQNNATPHNSHMLYTRPISLIFIM